MTIIVFHVHDRIDFNSLLIASAVERQLAPVARDTPKLSVLTDVAQAVWNRGGYREAGRVDFDDFDVALQSRRGTRTTGVGDILRIATTGEMFVVDTFGFAPLLFGGVDRSEPRRAAAK